MDKHGRHDEHIVCVSVSTEIVTVLGMSYGSMLVKISSGYGLLPGGSKPNLTQC